MAIVQVKKRPKRLPDGRYVIKNRAADFFWYATDNPITMVSFYSVILAFARTSIDGRFQVNEHSLIIQVFRG
jgi:hypothetical protein